MVIENKIHQSSEFIWNALFQIELFLLEKVGFQAKGFDYDLIMFTPQAEHNYIISYSIIVSSEQFDKVLERQLVQDLFHKLYRELPKPMHAQINSIQIKPSDSNFVKDAKLFTNTKQDFPIRLTDVSFGDSFIDLAYLLKSKLLPYLKVGQSVIIKNKAGLLTTGVIYKVDKDFNLYYFKKYYVVNNPNEFNDAQEIANKNYENHVEEIGKIPLMDIDYIEEDKQLSMLLQSA